jgi:hypothetical protein
MPTSQVARGTYRGGHAQELEVHVTSEVIDDTQGIVLGSPYRRGELIQYQTLGGMRQFQRMGAMVQQQGLSVGVAGRGRLGDRRDDAPS